MSQLDLPSLVWSRQSFHEDRFVLSNSSESIDLTDQVIRLIGTDNSYKATNQFTNQWNTFHSNGTNVVDKLSRLRWFRYLRRLPPTSKTFLGKLVLSTERGLSLPAPFSRVSSIVQQSLITVQCDDGTNFIHFPYLCCRSPSDHWLTGLIRTNHDTPTNWPV